MSLVIVLLCLAAPQRLAAQQTPIRIGIYQNSPKIFVDESGSAQGFFPQIIDHLANSQGWRVTYVPCAWAQCLRRLESGDIDMMPDVALSRERQQRFKFGHEAVLHSWSYIYSKHRQPLVSLADLADQRVAVLDNSIQHKRLAELMRARGLAMRLVTTRSMSDVLAAVGEGRSDYGIVNRFFGQAHEERFGVDRSTVLFQPLPLYFAHPKSFADATIGRIDASVATLKADPDSIYYRAIDKWLRPPKGFNLPLWAYWVLAGLAGALVASIVTSVYLRRRVADATAKIRDTASSLDDSENRYRTLVQGQADLICRNLPDGTLLFVNDAYCRFFGKSAEQLVGTNLLELIPAHSRQFVLNNLAALSAGQPVQTQEHEVISPSGEVRWQQWTNTAMIDADGAVVELVAVGRDTTERRRTEDTLRESEARAKNLFENAEVAIFDEDFSQVHVELNRLRRDNVRDLRGYLAANQQAAWDLAAMVKINQVNKAALNLFGAEAEHQLLQSIDTIFGPDAIDVFVDGLCAIWEGKEVFRAEASHRTLGGEKLTVIISMPIARTAEGLRSVPVSILDITERKEAEEALSFQATHDGLTGLINRREFERRLGRVLETARNSPDEHALCYLDLDQFKVINDTSGHMAGDELLRQVGELLSRTVRKRDTLARLGGDEFGVLMEHCTLPQARRVANKVRSAVADFRFLWAGRVFRIGVSMGLVPITEPTQGVASLLSAADSACYAAKDEGRNRVHVYRLGDSELARRQGEMHWVARIHHALEEKRFRLWSQSIVPITPGSGAGGQFELLLRLIDEQGTTILPGAFLPAAERYGLSASLDRWVVGAALAWLGRNPERAERLNLCFINLSGSSLADEEFLESVSTLLAQSAVAPEKICFEITETAAIANLSRAMTFMTVLKGQGCKFALDDFGSGLSSFGYLKTLPVDYLKIDGSFVRDIARDEVDLALVRSINDVGKAMGKWTIAESVEDAEILAKLRTIQVDFAQGYGISRPATIAERAGVEACRT